MKTKRTLFALILVLWAASLYAMTPESLSYQGYLTDRDGSPENGDVLITFSIYAVEVGGTFQWTDTMLAQVENGLMNVELGRPGNPFPVDLFETPLWLGIQVEADAEMIPRRALTSVGFSFKAKDADSLQGKSSADLDQSAHTDDLANPHGVTAAQAGAADQANFDAHTADTSNPHEVTSAQTGGTDAGVFSAHAADQSAHHLRYTDGEAVSAILAVDGAGSLLDADKLDGVDGSVFQSDISANSASISSNTTAILGIQRPLSVFANGQYVGAFLDQEDNNVTVLTDQRYVVILNGPRNDGSGVILRMSRTLYFEGLSCSGQAHALDVPQRLVIQGTAFQSGDDQAYYIPQGTDPQFNFCDLTFSSRLGNQPSEPPCVQAGPPNPNYRCYEVQASSYSLTGFDPPYYAPVIIDR